MARRRNTPVGDPIKVTFYDVNRKKSFTVTAYGGRLEDVTREGVLAIQRRWTTTSLTDRRHKPRF